MGRQIPTDRPLSDEDRAFLTLWSRSEEIVRHDELFPPGSKPKPAAAQQVPDDDEDGVDVDSDISDYAESLKVADLRDVLEANDIEYDHHAKRDELVASLAIGLQDKRNAGDTVNLGE